jgi:predicted outer membrane repeat protein
MHNSGSSPTVTHCTFSGNTAVFPEGISIGGGLSSTGGSPTVTDCTFSNNAADTGGGMNITGGTVTDCTFSNNTAEFGGGGMYGAALGGSTTVTRCTFDSNTDDAGGGMWNNDGTVTDCTFSNNSAGSGGGGMVSEGGGMGNAGSTVTDCIFVGNDAALCAGMDNRDSTVTNCVLIGNHATNLGGGMCHTRTNSVTNCTFSANSANLIASDMYNHQTNSTVVVTNCIFDVDGIQNAGANLTIAYSNVRGGLPASAIDGGGNIDADPLFVDPNGDDNILGTEDDNLRQTPGSPCIDAGNNAAVPAGVMTDIDGNPRIFDGNQDQVATVDMGAYESQYATVPTVSDWGLAVMALLTLVAGTIVTTQRGRAKKPGTCR